jgi:uncharacterized protein
VILLDTSGLWAALDKSQRHHEAAAEILREATAPLVLSPFVLAELDYLLATRIGPHAALALLEDVSRGAYALAPFDSSDVNAARDVVARFGEDIGLADASIVVLAQRHKTNAVLTLDERHFRTLRGSGDKPFRLLPLDSS